MPSNFPTAAALILTVSGAFTQQSSMPASVAGTPWQDQAKGTSSPVVREAVRDTAPHQDASSPDPKILPPAVIQVPSLEIPDYNLTLTLEDLAITDLLFVFVDLEGSQKHKILYHGKLTAKQLINGAQKGTHLSGQLRITTGPTYGKLLFRARILCDQDKIGSMHLDPPSYPYYRNHYHRIHQQMPASALIFSYSDCSDSVTIQREITLTDEDSF